MGPFSLHASKGSVGVVPCTYSYSFHTALHSNRDGFGLLSCVSHCFSCSPSAQGIASMLMTNCTRHLTLNNLLIGYRQLENNRHSRGTKPCSGAHMKTLEIPGGSKNIQEISITVWKIYSLRAFRRARGLKKNKENRKREIGKKRRRTQIS